MKGLRTHQFGLASKVFVPDNTGSDTLSSDVDGFDRTEGRFSETSTRDIQGMRTWSGSYSRSSTGAT
jgi:hypothetical protein